MVGRDTPEPNARGDYVRPRTVQADVFEPRNPLDLSTGSVNAISDL